MKGLSTRQREILEYMHERLVEDQVLPSYREIGDAMGIKSTNGVSDHVRALERKGFLERRGGTGKGALARSMTLTDKAFLEVGEAANEPDPILTGDVIEIGPFVLLVDAGTSGVDDSHESEKTFRLELKRCPNERCNAYVLDEFETCMTCGAPLRAG